jgi:hypothetical protein
MPVLKPTYPPTLSNALSTSPESSSPVERGLLMSCVLRSGARSVANRGRLTASLMDCGQ